MLSAKQKCVGKKHFHITQHLCPNCCPNNADQLSPPLPQIQPIDAALLAAVKSKSDAYHSVVSTSPVLYLTHPSSQPLRRPLTLNLPCPPNPEKKRHTRGQGELPDHQTWPISASAPWDQPASHRRWVKVWPLCISVKDQWAKIRQQRCRGQLPDENVLPALKCLKRTIWLSFCCLSL